ncbi:hypothetical protein [Ruegeria sp. HKCCA4633]|uniref:hypothetical protein n=1 Tax=Ruegeria sp. HKCCA4633 TaxID=2682983 RepID=UPI0014877524|nr:hypothetical protein [Ruegeria sp. HKCCA4633]
MKFIDLVHGLSGINLTKDRKQLLQVMVAFPGEKVETYAHKWKDTDYGTVNSTFGKMCHEICDVLGMDEPPRRFEDDVPFWSSVMLGACDRDADGKWLWTLRPEAVQAIKAVL